MQKLWFRAKRYGYGWFPITWEGWAVILAYLIVVLLMASRQDGKTSPESLYGFLTSMMIFTALLIVICYKHGEKPRWRWGGKD